MTQPNAVSPQWLLDLMRSRRSIRRYRPDPVPDEMIQQVLEAGRWAPSANNQQPWAFVVVQDEEIRCRVAQHASYYLDRQARVKDVPLLVVLCGRMRDHALRKSLRGEVGMAGMQMMLQAHALGLGTCWIDGLDRDQIARVLNLPDDLAVVGLLTVGFPAEVPAETSRKPVFEIVHYDVYDSVIFGGNDDQP